jgi:DNA mismatch repair protein MutH
MSEDLRFGVVQRLKRIIGQQNIADLAATHNVTIQRDGRVNKGWVGQTIDRIAKTAALSAQAPDGEDFELKSVKVAWNEQYKQWEPKETMAITMMNPKKILLENFEDSALWHKLSRMILMGHSYDLSSSLKVTVRYQPRPIDISDPELVTNIKLYWEQIKTTVSEGKISLYSSKGTSKGFIQLRTKGSGGEKGKIACPISGIMFNSRAFYATKPFLNYVLGVHEH